jgi:hypothetical protein
MSDPMYTSLVTGKIPPPPAFKMNAMEFMHDILNTLPFGLNPKIHAEIFKAEINYLKRCSEVTFEFYTTVGNILNKPIEQIINKSTSARKRKQKPTSEPVG